MNWMLIVFVVSVATGDSVINTVSIPMETENICIEGKHRLKKAYLDSNSANWVLISECLQVRGG
jgi:hypothetical protein